MSYKHAGQKSRQRAELFSMVTRRDIGRIWLDIKNWGKRVEDPAGGVGEERAKMAGSCRGKFRGERSIF